MSSLEDFDHFAVGDALFQEHFSHFLITVPSVERLHVFLGVEGDLPKPQRPPVLFKEREHHAAHAIASPIPFHGHAADVRALAIDVGEQPAGGDNSASIQRNGMDRVGRGIRVVNLHVRGDTLLADKHAHPHGDGSFELSGGFGYFDGNVGGWVFGRHFEATA